MTPARAGRKLASAIPGARVIEIPGAGHMMMTEKPDETLDALRTAF
jgi:pimeloyl-ACP methyl ester carboxylesterase